MKVIHVIPLCKKMADKHGGVQIYLNNRLQILNWENWYPRAEEQSGTNVIEKKVMLHSAKHEIFPAHKC